MKKFLILILLFAQSALATGPGFLRVSRGIHIDADHSTGVSNSLGDIEIDGSTGVAKLHNGSSASQILTAAHSATVTNKGIDANTNTISNIANANIAAAAGIVDTKLATISTSGKVSNSATTATSSNTNSAIVARDGSGNFSASTISAALTGTASGNTTITPANHATVVSSGTNALSTVGPSSSTVFPLVSGGSSADPSYALLTVPGGGSGLATITNHSVLLGAGTSAINPLALNASTAFPLVSGGSSADPSWSLLGFAGGGTGFSSYTDGQVLIGKTSDGSLNRSTLTAGSGITITNGSGTITIASTGGSTTAFKLPNNLGFASSVGGNALTFETKQQNGISDPSSGSGAVSIPFRSPTATDGSWANISITARTPNITTLTIPSGATLGSASGVTMYGYLYFVDNASTAELAVSLSKYDDGSIVSTSGMSVAASNPGTIYSNAARSNVPITAVGRFKFNESTAGTWASNVSELTLKPFEEVVVGAMYTDSTSQSLANTASVTILAGNRVFDTHNAYNTSTGNFTCPIAGIYRIAAHAAISTANWDAGDRFSLIATQNGSDSQQLTRGTQTATHTTVVDVGGNQLMNCAAGDTLSVYVTQTSGGTTTLSGAANQNWVEFTRLNGVY